MKVKQLFRFINLRIPKWVFQFIPMGRRKESRPRKRWGYKPGMPYTLFLLMVVRNDEAGTESNRGNLMLHWRKNFINLCYTEQNKNIWKRRSRWTSPTTERSNSNVDMAVQAYHTCFSDIHIITRHFKGHAVVQYFETLCYKVAGSISDDALGIFQWHNPSGRTMTLGSTQPLTEMSTGNISWGGKGGRCVRLTTLPPSCADCLEIWEPQTPGILRACPGL